MHTSCSERDMSTQHTESFIHRCFIASQRILVRYKYAQTIWSDYEIKVSLIQIFSQLFNNPLIYLADQHSYLCIWILDIKKSKDSYRIINNKVSITSYGNLKYNETWYGCDKREHAIIRHLKLRLILEDKHWFEI